MMPPENIITRKVDEWELRRQFNDPSFRADLMRRTSQQVESYCKPAPPEARQVPGATSHVYDWFEYSAETGETKLLATVHLYKNPDGTIGASGQPDPQILVIGNVILVDP
jgi:hypothetical protein